MSTPEEIVEANLAAPAKVTSDGVTVEQHKLADQVAAAKSLSANTGVSNPYHRGIYFNRIVGHGPTG